MLAWLQTDLGTIVVVLVLAVLVALAIRKLCKSKKAGEHACGCGCEHCALRDKCHPADK